MILFIIVFSFASFYMCRTLGVLRGNGDSKYKLEHYSVVVLKESKYKKLSDIKKETVGYFANSKGSKLANDKLKESVDVKFNSYQASDSMVDELLSKKINVILIENSVKEIMSEEIENFESNTKVIYTFTIKVKSDSTLKDVDVTEKPFTIYMSGIDTYGEISSVSRSDVNIVMVVNPKTNQILLISIPRDYYVQLHGTTGTRDKLTHAGIYGTDMSIKTLEDLLDVEINYYLKVNFTSVIDIVDALGGLDVYSEYTFVSYSNFNFKKGMNHVNGEQALDFARTRKAFIEGDRQRGKNQQALIEAIIRKSTNKSIITKYNSLLSAIDGKYQTNMSAKKITSLIKMQLKNMPSWNITSYSLTGSDSNNYTYTYNQLLYVMEPDKDTVNEAIQLIDKVLDGEKLDSSYNDISDKISNVTKSNVSSYKPSIEEPIKEEVKEIEQQKKESIKEESTKEEIKEEQTKEKSNEESIKEESTKEDSKEDDEDILDPIMPSDDELSLNLEENSKENRLFVK